VIITIDYLLFKYKGTVISIQRKHLIKNFTHV